MSTEKNSKDPDGLSENGRFFVFDTHPIQYRTPVFRALAQRHPGLKVYYLNPTFNGNRWWFYEAGKTPPVFSRANTVSKTMGFSNEVVGSNRLGLLGFYRWLKALLLDPGRRPEAVLLYGYYLPEHWILMWLCHRNKVPLLFVGESFREGNSSLRRFLKRFVRPFFFRRVDRFISIGQRTLEFYRSLKIEESRITQAKYCVDVSFFAMEPNGASQVRTSLRKKLKIPANAFVVLFVGRLFDRKRPFDAVQIHRRLCKRRGQVRPVHTIFVGSGELQESLAQETFNDDNIHLVGFKRPDEIREFYHASDILLVPSAFETWGLVVNEAFSAGLPAVATEDCGVSSDLLLSGETGYTYPTGNIDVAVVILQHLLEDPDELQRLADNALNKVRHYDVDQFADAMLDALHSSSPQK